MSEERDVGSGGVSFRHASVLRWVLVLSVCPIVWPLPELFVIR